MSSLALIGFMGSGKTSVGRLLAARLGCGFTDTDELAAELAGMSVREVFETQGEAAFRAYESRALELALGAGGAVIATGGGVVTAPGNLAALKRAGRLPVVYLRVSPGAALRRLEGDETRPLLLGDGKALAVERILAERGPLYEQAACLTVDTDGLTPGETADLICQSLNLRGASAYEG